MNLSRLGEFGWIRRLQKSVPLSPGVRVGIGDDTAAVLPSPKGHLLLLTCDSVIEGIHFDSKATPFQIGWKAMARNLSDIAAMGGTPLHALVAAALPSQTPVRVLDGIQQGIQAAAQKFGVSLVGGDTARSRGGIHLTVTLTGEVPEKQILLRSGAQAGHFVCVTGTLGGSIHGKHLRFAPRIHEARFLAKLFRPTSMMDLSDGLASDLHRLAEQSHVGFEIWSEKLPISAAIRTRCKSRARQVQHALCDGEDYELLFTLSPHLLPRLQAAWKKRFRIPITPIGQVLPHSKGIRLRSSSGSGLPHALAGPSSF